MVLLFQPSLTFEDFLGEVSLKIKELRSDGKERWYPLQNRPADGLRSSKGEIEVKGDICIVFKMEHYGDDDLQKDGEDEKAQSIVKLIPSLKYNILSLIYCLEPILQLRQYLVKLVLWKEKPSSALFFLVSTPLIL